MACHALIPEAVVQFTSATFEKKKEKRYETPYGIFTYRDVPSDVYPLASNCIAKMATASKWHHPRRPSVICCQKFKTINSIQAKLDFIPFIRNPAALDVWHSDFFCSITEGLKEANQSAGQLPDITCS